MDTRPRGSVGLFGLYHFWPPRNPRNRYFCKLGRALRIRDLTALLCLCTRVLVLKANYYSTEL